MQQNIQEVHKIVIKSFNVTYLQSACLQLENLGQLFGFTVSSAVVLPKKTKKYMVLRSPHIYKKARDQFEIRTLKRALYLKAGPTNSDKSLPLLPSSGVCEVQDKFNLLFDFLAAYPPFGVSLKICSIRRFNCAIML